MYHGIINVYKPAGFTSFDVVAKLRGILKQKKIGHTGTLDPMATGVLPVCLGNGTKLCDMLTDRSKEYICQMLLGVASDTEDVTGKIENIQSTNLEKADIEAAVRAFIGDYDQIPPMYSALKVNGKKLYELAREGKVIERKPRRVCIHGIDIMEISQIKSSEVLSDETLEGYQLVLVKMKVACSKGTYIRSLCRDIGTSLGTYGCMLSLVRSRVGAFNLDNALTMEDIETLRDEDRLERAVLSLEMALDQYESLHIHPEYKKKIDNGNPLPLEAFVEEPDRIDGIKYKVYNAEGIFNAVYCFDEDKQLFMPDKFFPVDQE